MTRMTGPDCVVMCNLINTYIHTWVPDTRPFHHFIVEPLFPSAAVITSLFFSPYREFKHIVHAVTVVDKCRDSVSFTMCETIR